MFGLGAGPSGLVPPQPPGWAHVVSVRRGAAVLTAASARVVVSPEIAMWIAPQVPYALDLRTRCDLRIAYVRAGRAAERASGPVEMTPLLRELLERATERGYLAPERPRDARLLSVIEDELGDLVAAHPARSLVLPRTARMRCAAERLIDQLDDAPSLRAIAAATDMSLRSFERNFAHETGLSPREWLRHARLSAASLALAAGASVTDAGLAAGYSSLSAFIAAYRSVYGTTPGRHGGRRTPQNLHREAFTAALFSW